MCCLNMQPMRGHCLMALERDISDRETAVQHSLGIVRASVGISVASFDCRYARTGLTPAFVLAEAGYSDETAFRDGATEPVSMLLLVGFNIGGRLPHGLSVTQRPAFAGPRPLP
jgi:hypothetical protein